MGLRLRTGRKQEHQSLPTEAAAPGESQKCSIPCIRFSRSFRSLRGRKMETGRGSSCPSTSSRRTGCPGRLAVASSLVSHTPPPAPFPPYAQGLPHSRRSTNFPSGGPFEDCDRHSPCSRRGSPPGKSPVSPPAPSRKPRTEKGRKGCQRRGARGIGSAPSAQAEAPINSTSPQWSSSSFCTELKDVLSGIPGTLGAFARRAYAPSAHGGTAPPTGVFPCPPTVVADNPQKRVGRRRIAQ